jgi:hypothetical protein
LFGGTVISLSTWENNDHVLRAYVESDTEIAWEIEHPENCPTKTEFGYTHHTCPIWYEEEAVGTADALFGFIWPPEKLLEQPVDELGDIAVEVGRQLLHSDEATVRLGAYWSGGRDYYGEYDYHFEFWVLDVA